MGVGIAHVAAITIYGDTVGNHLCIAVGTFSIGVLELSKVVNFDAAFPDSSYQVFVQPMGLVGASFWTTNLAVSGFTINLSLGVNATFAYIAVKV